MAPVWESAFLKALERCGVASEAAKLAGTGVRNAFKQRKANPTFAAAWDAAVALHRSEVGRQAMSAVAAEGFAYRQVEGGARVEAAGQSSGPRASFARKPASSRWTKRSEETFLLELSRTGSVRLAAKAAGFSTQAVYRRRTKDRHLAAAWDAAVEAGQARVRSYLVEAATRTFDPDELPIAEDHEVQKVSISEAINIVKLPGRSPGSSPGLRGQGGWHDPRYDPDYQPTEEERQELIQRILGKLEGLKARNDREMIEAGWTEHEIPAPPWYRTDGPGTVWIPPGWRLIGEGE